MAEEIQIMDTGDGSHTLLNVALDETYHSRHGALRESQHVYLKAGFYHWINLHQDKESLRIFEMGMGTGLNLMLTLQATLIFPEKQFEYITLEAFPLPYTVIEKLNYPNLLGDSDLTKLFEQVHRCPWSEWYSVLPNFQLKKLNQKLEDYNIEKNSVDLIYYDAFAPNKQAELWTIVTLGKVCSMLKPEGIFVTYSAKGQLKRDLKSLGLTVETLKGPPGKAEMIRATKSLINE